MTSPAPAAVPRKLVLGPRRCGKSEAVERELAAYRHRLYVGTLWDTPAYADTLAEHRARRGDGWALLEVTGTLEADARALAAQAATLGASGAVLVDGLTTWAARVAVTRGRMMQSALELAHVLVFLARRFPAVTWRWIDASPQGSEQDRALGPCSEALWGRLKDGIPDLVIEMWPQRPHDNGEF